MTRARVEYVADSGWAVQKRFAVPAVWARLR